MNKRLSQQGWFRALSLVVALEIIALSINFFYAPINVAAGGSAALNYYAEYYAKAQATAGSVATSVKYTIVYP